MDRNEPLPRCLPESGMEAQGEFQRSTKVVDWHRFEPRDFEYDFEADKLSAHGITFMEAVECFFSDYTVRRNKQFKDRFQLIGRTLQGKRLKLIFQLKPRSVVRIITGWRL